MEGQARMAPKRSKNTAHVQNQEELSRILRRRKMTLFIQQVEKEAQEQINELESRLDNLLANVDQVFKVELMKLPPSIRKMRFEDCTEEMSASEVSLVVQQQESSEMKQHTSKREPSRRGKSADPAPRSCLTRTNSSKTSKGAKRAKESSPATGSISAGNLRDSTSAVKGRRLTKTSDVSAKQKLRSVVSTGDLECSVAGSAAHITVTTGRGQTMCFSEANKDQINFDLLDDVALCRVKELSKLIQYVSGRGRSHS